MQPYNGSLEKGFQEWIIIPSGRNLQKTFRSYQEVRKAEILFWKQSPEGTFKYYCPKNHSRRKKTKKICSGGQSLKDHWSFYRLLPKMTLRYRLSSENNESFRKTFSKNTFGELLLTFQFFEQFDLKTRYFISNFQKLFSHRIFKNG